MLSDKLIEQIAASIPIEDDFTGVKLASELPAAECQLFGRPLTTPQFRVSLLGQTNITFDPYNLCRHIR